MDRREQQRIAAAAQLDGDDSPMIGRYTVGIDKHGLIDASQVVIAWNYRTSEEPKGIANVTVLYRPRDRMTADELHRFGDWISRYWSATAGNVSAKWMTTTLDDQGAPMQPTERFGDMLASGFIRTEELNRAVREFARIKECEWARRMLWNEFAADGSRIIHDTTD